MQGILDASFRKSGGGAAMLNNLPDPLLHFQVRDPGANGSWTPPFTYLPIEGVQSLSFLLSVTWYVYMQISLYDAAGKETVIYSKTSLATVTDATVSYQPNGKYAYMKVAVTNTANNNTGKVEIRGFSCT